MPQIYPILIVLVKDDPENAGQLDPYEWRELKRYTLTASTIRIGRSRDNEIVIDIHNERGSLVSRRQGTMFKQTELEDYEYLDGTIEDVTISNRNVRYSSSKSGTQINGRKLDVGEKVLLKDGDRITIIQNRLEFAYKRHTDTLNESSGELTYVPMLESEHGTDARTEV
jgi:pSer/pThr/pTyr-binding forkhead associated (FHA) protein